MARRVSNSGQTRIKRNLEAIMPLTRQIFSLLKYYVIGVAIVLLIANFIAKPVVVRGSSMNPTLNNFDICISNRLSIVLGGTIDRFDIVVAQTEEGEIVKRVVGIPGDTISYVNRRCHQLSGRRADGQWHNGRRGLYHRRSVQASLGYGFS